VKPGNEVTFTIPKFMLDKLNFDENVFVTSIDVNGKNYLSKTDVFENENSTINKYADFSLGGMFLVVGLVAYIKNRKI
jgi:hypothetical protein